MPLPLIEKSALQTPQRFDATPLPIMSMSKVEVVFQSGEVLTAAEAMLPYWSGKRTTGVVSNSR